ncbi:MAG: hypothetical protein U9R51_10640 [Actinomycetota bacterium]|nr:hypothetical protein [Actinomycetota bacterium]
MKRLILLVALIMAMAVLAPAAFADESADESSGAEMEEKDPSAAQLWKAEMIAYYFTDLFELDEGDEVTKTEVSALRAGGEDGHTIGWGVLYKLMLYAGPDGFDPGNFESGWAIGQLKKGYDGDVDLHKNNLGQAQKAAKDKPEKAEKATPPGQQKKAEKARG